jgi:hypothetical protein
MPIGGGNPVHNHSSGAQGGRSLASHIPPGVAVEYYGAGQPGANADDYLECNGQNVSRTTYANLFVAIGTTWGVGDGATTFTLPDRRRRVAVGAGGTGTATLGNAVGDSGGAEDVTLLIANLAAHSHKHGSPTGQPAGSGDPRNVGGSSVTSTTVGSDTAHNNLPPSIVCGIWIKT